MQITIKLDPAILNVTRNDPLFVSLTVTRPSGPVGETGLYVGHYAGSRNLDQSPRKPDGAGGLVGEDDLIHTLWPDGNFCALLVDSGFTAAEAVEAEQAARVAVQALAERVGALQSGLADCDARQVNPIVPVLAVQWASNVSPAPWDTADALVLDASAGRPPVVLGRVQVECSPYFGNRLAGAVQWRPSLVAVAENYRWATRMHDGLIPICEAAAKADDLTLTAAASAALAHAEARGVNWEMVLGAYLRACGVDGQVGDGNPVYTTLTDGGRVVKQDGMVVIVERE